MRWSRRGSESRMLLRRCLITVLGVAVLVSCERRPNSARPFAVIFVVESDPGVRLRRALVSVDGDPAGESDSNGVVRTTLYGAPGQRLTIKLDCPDGHEGPSEPKILRLRRFERIGGPEPAAMEITLRCEPTKRLAVFIVRAKNGPDLPVLLNGERVARTNRSGVAHFSTWGATGTDYTVELDTREHPQLLPQLPKHLFTLPDADEICVLNQSFDVKSEPRRRGHRRARITKIE